MAYIGNPLKTATFLIDSFNGDDGTVDFTLREAPGTPAAILVFVGGVRQHTDAYSVSSTTLTFTDPPPTGTNNIQVLFLGLNASPSVPSDSSVTAQKILDGAVTATKLANTAVTSGNYGGASSVPSITVDDQGRLTYAANVAIETGFNPFLLAGL